MGMIEDGSASERMIAFFFFFFFFLIHERMIARHRTDNDSTLSLLLVAKFSRIPFPALPVSFDYSFLQVIRSFPSIILTSLGTTHPLPS